MEINYLYLMISKLDAICEKNVFVQFMSQKTKLRPLFVAALTIFILTMILRRALIQDDILLLIFCLHVKCFENFQAIKHGITKENVKPLFSFWICLILFLVINMVSPFKVDYLPLSCFFKLGVVLFLHHENSKYSIKIVDNLITPFLTAHEEKFNLIHKSLNECFGKKVLDILSCFRMIISGSPNLNLIHPEKPHSSPDIPDTSSK